MPFIQQSITVDFMHKTFDVFVLLDDAGIEYRTAYNRLAFDVKRLVEGSDDFRDFLMTYDADGARRADIRVEVDPYEDEGDGYGIRLLVAFPVEFGTLPMALPEKLRSI